MSDSKFTIVVGTSGSTDYLNEEAGSQRFWPVRLDVPLRDLDESCDGLHAEGAPPQYLCTRCFPDLVVRSLGRDLFQLEDEVIRHEDQEMG